MSVKAATVISLLLSSLFSAGQSFGTIDRTPSARMPYYLHPGTAAPTLINTVASSPHQPWVSQPVESHINPTSVLSASSNPSSVDENTRMRINQSYGKLPLRFEVNVGQTDRQVKFITRGSGYRMFFTPTETVMVLSQAHEQGKPRIKDWGELIAASSASPSKVQYHAIRMQLKGANPTPKMTGVDMLPGKSNYFIGSDPKQWRTNVANYKKIRYQEVYPGIDLVYYGNQRKLEYDFIVQPGADPKVIQLAFAGIESYSIETGGDLILHTAQGDVIQKKPVIYQQIAGQRVAVVGSYKSLDDDRVTFHLQDYDKTLALVIDPVLEYSTFLGGSGFDRGYGIVLDADNNAYVTGQTNAGAAAFPSTAGAFDETHNGDFDVFVSKLNADGSDLVYSTFLGGNGFDEGRGIAVDADGNAYVTGETRGGTFPTTTGAFDETHNGSADVFVSKLNVSGSNLAYSTFLGSSGFEQSLGIGVDADANAYVTGWTNNGTPAFPTTAGSFDETHNGFEDVFVSKLNASGSDLAYSTFLGGSGSDKSSGIALDADGNAYVTGLTTHGTFPTTAGAFNETHNGEIDVFVSKLNASGSDLAYSTFLGGSGSDQGLGIAVDADSNAYVTGLTRSGTFPTTAGAFDETHNGNIDVFVSKLNASGSDLAYSTLLGGSGSELGWGIAVDADGNAYVTGLTDAGTFPTTAGAFDETHNGDNDVFVSKLNASGSDLAYSTFLGSNGFDQGLGIAVNADGNAYVTGWTFNGTPAFSTTAGAFDETHNGSGDVFISKISDNTTPTMTSSNTASVAENQTSVIDVQATDDLDTEGAGLTFSLTGGADQALFSIDTDNGVVTFNSAPDFEAPADTGLDNNYDIQVTVTDSGGLTDIQDIVISVTDVVETFVIVPLWIPVDRSSDDAEEEVFDGDMRLSSSDLELIRESSDQLVGIRYNGLAIPPGATILSSYIQFQADETDTEQTVLTLQAETTGNAVTFSSTDLDISSRMLTTAEVQWTVPEWNSVGAAGPDQATPDLSAIVQEVVDGDDWASGNSIAFIISGRGKRVAESFNGTAPPMLHLEFSIEPPVNQAPDAVDDGTLIDPAYATGIDLELRVPNGAKDIVDRNDNVGFPTAEVTEFGTGPNSAGTLGTSFKGGDLTVYSNGSFDYTPPVGFSGVDHFDYVLVNIGGQDTATVFIKVLDVTPLWIPVDHASDDAEEDLSNGDMDLNSSDLELTRESSEQQVGIRFNGLTIPQGAKIVNATLQFTVDETDSEPTVLMLQAEATGNAATFSSIDLDISSRMRTIAEVQWTVPVWNSVGAAGADQSTPDLGAIIQELVNRGDWAPGNAIAFIIDGSGKRVAESFNGTTPPMLHVVYSNEPPVDQAPDAVDDNPASLPAYTTSLDQVLTVPNGAGDIVERNDDIGFPAATVTTFGPTGTEYTAGFPGTSDLTGVLTVYADGSFSYIPPAGFSGIDSFDYTLSNDEGSDTATVSIEVLNLTPLWIPVDRSSDDAEEELSNGDMSLTSSDLEMIKESSDQLVGIRYNGVSIPQGAIIVNAYIQFTVDETDSKPTVLTVQAEVSGNAATFSSTDFDISSRMRTITEVQWNVPEWNSRGAAGPDQATPDLSAIVQELVNRGDWAQGNSIAFIITGSGKRVAESFNGTAPPILHLEFSTAPPP